MLTHGNWKLILMYMLEEQDPFLGVCTIFPKIIQHIFLIPDRVTNITNIFLGKQPLLFISPQDL